MIILPSGLVAELDEFHDLGLMMVEVELSSPHISFTPPAWFGREVSTDPRYFNNSLAAHGRPQDHN